MNIEELLSQVDIVEVVSYYIPDLKPVGRNFRALCPFHVEDTPSFFVSPEKQIFKCFGCGVGGNAITFVQKIENISFWEAIKKICDICSLPYPEDLSVEDDNRKNYEKILNFFKEKLETNLEVLSYLENRGINQDIRKKFELGFAPQGYSKVLKSLGFNLDFQRKIGLLNENYYELFKDRIIFPIYNESGKLVGFAGRTIKPNVEPKYINTKENEIFKKRKLLYGLYQAKEDIKFLKEEGILIVEGYFDVLSCHKIGLKNAVAPMGTSLTLDQVNKALIYSKKVILGFDGDFAGIKATFRAISLFLEKLFTKIFVLDLPSNEDPDSLILKNKEEFFKIYENKLPFEDFLVKKLKEYQNEEDRFFELLDILGEILGKLKAYFYYRYINLKSTLCEKLNLSEFLIEKYEKTFRETTPKNKTKSVSITNLPVPTVEKIFIKSLLEDLIKKGYEIDILKALDSNLFFSQEIQKIFNEIVFGKNLTYKDLSLKFKDDENINELISEIATLELEEEESILEHSYFVAYKEILKRNINAFYKKSILKKLSSKIIKEIKNLKELLEDAQDFKDLINLTKNFGEVSNLGHKL